ncbi:hypothetical protein, partial [Enterobacter hormaechei]|uniref:hypothetical protein n=1 Tax=Enterobacter hormaechei TaxID=158836 RepID=UPI002E2E8CB4|nr:hypothetical protein [Enterobacter hormaechei]
RKTFRKLDDILAIEDALTRISNQLTKAIKQQEELVTRGIKLQLLNAQTEKAEADAKIASNNADKLTAGGRV